MGELKLYYSKINGCLVEIQDTQYKDYQEYNINSHVPGKPGHFKYLFRFLGVQLNCILANDDPNWVLVENIEMAELLYG